MTTPTFGDFYTTGTISLTHDATAFTGSGVLWSDIEQGDLIFTDGAIGVVDTIGGSYDSGTLQVAWGGSTVTDADYVIIKLGKSRFDPALTQVKLRQFLTFLAGAGIIYYVTADEPDDSIGEDGQYALKTNALPWTLWLKQSGAWVLQGTAAGVNPKGVWAVATGYIAGDVVNRLGALYYALQPSTGQVPELSATVTITIASPGVVTDTGHGLANGTAVMLSTTGALPSGLTAGVTYYVVSAATNTYRLAATVGGTAINTSGTQSGVHTRKSGYWSLLMGNGDSYDVGGYSPDRPASSENILSFLFPRSVFFPAGLTGSRAKAGTAATSSAVFSIQKNSVQVGTVTIASSATVGTFSFLSDVTFAAGDILDIIAPSPRDATLADMHVTLSGSR